MIRPLTEADRMQLLALLGGAAEHNLYFLGNLETLGFGQPLCRFWGEFSEEGLLRAAANRYMTGWGVYGVADADWSAVATLIDGDPEASRLQDNPGGIPSLLPYLRLHRAAQVDEEELMRLDAADFRPQQAPPGLIVRGATLDDLQVLTAHYADAGSMRRTPLGVERPLRDGIVYLGEMVEDGNRVVVSSALTNAQTRSMAMVGGVYTPEERRGRGYGRAVCTDLCKELIQRGLVPILYWKTAAAGRVYRTLGFHAIGTWRAVRLEPAAGDAGTTA